MVEALQYQDVCLLPKYTDLLSRSQADVSLSLCDYSFQNPVVPANMKAVIDYETASWMSRNEYFYIMHRFDIDMYDLISRANDQDWKTISFSIGVQDSDKTILHKLRHYKQRVDFITIDIAHGHCAKMKKMIKTVADCLPSTKIIAGNVATADAVYDLASWGADVVKVGIGQGNVCTTKDKTGFTLPMFSCTQSCSNIIYNQKRVPIIADGGIRCNGDIAKALVAGADLVMIGSMFSQCIDSAAATVYVDGRTYKQYFGSASEHNKTHKRHIEGVMKEVPSNNMTIAEKLEEIEQDLQSAVSYSGGTSLQDLRDVEFAKCISK